MGATALAFSKATSMHMGGRRVANMNQPYRGSYHGFSTRDATEAREKEVASGFLSPFSSSWTPSTGSDENEVFDESSEYIDDRYGRLGDLPQHKPPGPSNLAAFSSTLGHIGSTLTSATPSPMAAMTKDMIALKVNELSSAIQQQLEETLMTETIDKLPRTPSEGMQHQIQQMQVTIEQMQQKMASMETTITELRQQASTAKACTCSQDATGKGPSLRERVATLEGRQSVFQSQLAHFWKGLDIKKGGGNATSTKAAKASSRDESKAPHQPSEPTLSQLASLTEFVAALITSKVKPEIDAMRNELMESFCVKLEEERQHLGQEMQQLQSQFLAQEETLGMLVDERESLYENWPKKVQECVDNVWQSKQGLVHDKLAELRDWLCQMEGELATWHSDSREQEKDIVQKRLQTLATQCSDLAANSEHLTASLDNRLKQMQQQYQAQIKQQCTHLKKQLDQDQDQAALQEQQVQTLQKQVEDQTDQLQKLRHLIAQQLRKDHTAEEMLQSYVSTITQQVAAVTRQYVSVRIQDNNRLLDGALRKRIPAYVANESEDTKIIPKESLATPMFTCDNPNEL